MDIIHARESKDAALSMLLCKQSEDVTVTRRLSQHPTPLLPLLGRLGGLDLLRATQLQRRLQSSSRNIDALYTPSLHGSSSLFVVCVKASLP